jgi:uroporphyrinogen-III synthase
MVPTVEDAPLAATVGPVTAAPLQELGLEPLLPERFRRGAMLKELTDVPS